MKRRLPAAWDDEKVERVITYYETQSDIEAATEDEAALAEGVWMQIPAELVGRVRLLLAEVQGERQGRILRRVEPVFEWDAEKAASNLEKHGVPFSAARKAFLDPFNLTVADPDHSVEEERFLLLGFAEGSILVVSFTERRGAVRIISCRRANVRERRAYGQGR